MRWNVLLPPLAAILLAALAFAFWPHTPEPLPPDPGLTAPLVAPALPGQPTPTARSAPSGSPAPTTAIAPAAPPAQAPVAPQPSAAPGDGRLALDPEVDPEHLRALGLDEQDVEPADAGPLHAVDAKGIKAAVQEKLPEIKECYEGWLAQNPALSGKLKVEFRIGEIPGRDRAKVMDIDIPDGGMGHVAMEGCVKNVFAGLRFETPRGGELRVTYPLAFQSGPAEHEKAPPPP